MKIFYLIASLWCDGAEKVELMANRQCNNAYENGIVGGHDFFFGSVLKFAIVGDGGWYKTKV